jgi:hypothetical protein
VAQIEFVQLVNNVPVAIDRSLRPFAKILHQQNLFTAASKAVKTVLDFGGLNGSLNG